MDLKRAFKGMLYVLLSIALAVALLFPAALFVLLVVCSIPLVLWLQCGKDCLFILRCVRKLE